MGPHGSPGGQGHHGGDGAAPLLAIVAGLPAHAVTPQVLGSTEGRPALRSCGDHPVHVEGCRPTSGEAGHPALEAADLLVSEGAAHLVPGGAGHRALGEDSPSTPEDADHPAPGEGDQLVHGTGLSHHPRGTGCRGHGRQYVKRSGVRRGLHGGVAALLPCPSLTRNTTSVMPVASCS